MNGDCNVINVPQNDNTLKVLASAVNVTPKEKLYIIKAVRNHLL